MKRFALLALMAGFALMAVLVAGSGAREVGEAVAAAGWATLLVVVIRAGDVALAGAAWWLLFPHGERPDLRACIGLRFVREGTNALLPLGQVGGDLIGARLLTLGGTKGSLAVASVIADMMVQAGTQFLFTAVGLAALILLGGDTAMARFVAGGLALAAPALIGFYLVQRRAGQRLIEPLLRRAAGGRDWHALGAVEDVYGRLRAIYAGRGGVAAGVSLHLVAWLVGAAEVWVALAAMGHPVSWTEALVIESLGQAVRGAAFVVPGAIGVQEGGYIALCALFGVPSQAALALSLVKRVPDLVLGLPGVLTWQVLEGRRALRPAAARADDGPAGYMEAEPLERLKGRT